jgi:hypothetical protein
MSQRDTYIQRLENARAEMREIVRLAKHNPTIYEPWRMKEVLDHITGWDDAVIASIRSLLAGERHVTPIVRGLDDYNAETVSSRETIPYALTQQEWTISRAVLLNLIRDMTDEQLKMHFVLPWGTYGTIEELVETFTEHEETHAREISEILQKVRVF